MEPISFDQIYSNEVSTIQYLGIYKYVPLFAYGIHIIQNPSFVFHIVVQTSTRQYAIVLCLLIWFGV